MSLFSRFFKKQEAAPAEAAPAAAPPEFNFKQRVEAFWIWYAGVAERFYQTIEDKQCPSLAEEVSAKVDELLPMAWVFGPGPDRKGHSFTLSGEGNLPKQILAAEWLKRAPEIPGWTFHASRQAEEEVRDFSLQMRELTFRPIEFWVTPEIDEEREVVDITVWHPLLGQAEKRMCETALFLFLDEIFGELGTGRWIGAIEYSQAKLATSMPINELKEFVDGARGERGWKMHPPGELLSHYRIPEDKRATRFRLDTISGMTACWRPLGDFLEDPENAEDPFDACGANWIYLSFDSSALTKGREVDCRYDMEEAIGKALEEEGSGLVLGGAVGTHRTYLDFVIYDGSRSLALIRGAARAAGLPPDTRVEYLGAAKRGRNGPLFPGA